MKYNNLTDFIDYFERYFNESTVILDGFETYYPQQVEEFMRKFFGSALVDCQYGKKMDLNNWWNETILQNIIPTMSIEDIGTCITAILRQERFSSGTIFRFIRNGILIKLLKQLKKLDT